MELHPEGYQNRSLELAQELIAVRGYLQTTVEELATSNEELTSTNEELQSANEELQSTNEELETSKEELQSINEELVTVNVELQSKIDELSQANNDLNNLLATLDVGIIFLDRFLNIQRFNPYVTHLLNLIETDVGRPMSHIASNLNYDRLTEVIQEVLESLVPKRLEVQTKDNERYGVRIRPYRTAENAIEGVLVTFTERTH
jgi:two-component system, chemotaxis family, CheB/CheR fusion protein